MSKMNKISYVCLIGFFICSGFLVFSTITKPVDVITGKANAEPYLGFISGYGDFEKVNETLSYSFINLKLSSFHITNNTVDKVSGYNVNTDFNIEPNSTKLNIDDQIILKEIIHKPICTHSVYPAPEFYPSGKLKFSVVYKDENACPSNYSIFQLYEVVKQKVGSVE